MEAQLKVEICKDSFKSSKDLLIAIRARNEQIEDVSHSVRVKL